MKVLLIVPSFTHIYGKFARLYRGGFLNPPLSLCYLASSLIKNGHESVIIDGEAEQLSDADILGRMSRERPGLLGFTATSIDFSGVQRLFRKAKQRFPEIPCVLGGTHINLFGAKILEDNPELDFGCIGDGEDFIVELADALENRGAHQLDGIPGLVRRKDGTILENPPRIPEPQIDRFPFPARELLKEDLYPRSIPGKGMVKTAAFMSSRGCPYSCVYCAVKNIYGGTQVRLRSAENVLEEIEYLVRVRGFSHIAFNDDCLTIHRERMVSICRGILKKGLSFTWEGLSRADLVDEELLKLMYRSGFTRISFGIESGDPRILNILQKKETLGDIERAISWAHNIGIVTRGSVILGNPMETRNTVLKTLRFINRLKGLDQVVINIMQPYPGTRLREMAMNGEYGLQLHEETSGFDQLRRFGSSHISVNDLKPKDLVFYQKYGFLRFYLRPNLIFRNFRINGFKPFLGDGLNFLRSMIGV